MNSALNIKAKLFKSIT